MFGIILQYISYLYVPFYDTGMMFYILASHK